MKAQHFVYIILGAVLIVGLFLPVDKDVDVSEPTSEFFKSVGSLPDYSMVLLATDFDANSRAEMVPQLQIVTEHLMERNLRIIAISMWDQGPMFADRILKNTGKEMDKTYGVDYVNLGYAAGVHSMVRLLKDDIRAVYKKDFSGNAVNDMEILEGIEGATDIPMMIVISDRPSSAKTYIEQIQSFKKDYRIVCGLTATTVPPLTPYIQSGQIEGYIIGLKGASEYEFLMEEVGLGRRAMSAQSIGQITIIILIIAGNLFAIIRKGRE
jgi:hypothetical protein